MNAHTYVLNEQMFLEHANKLGMLVFLEKGTRRPGLGKERNFLVVFSKVMHELVKELGENSH